MQRWKISSGSPYLRSQECLKGRGNRMSASQPLNFPLFALEHVRIGEMQRKKILEWLAQSVCIGACSAIQTRGVTYDLTRLCQGSKSGS